MSTFGEREMQTYEGYDVVEKEGLADCAAYGSYKVRVYDVDVEMV